MGSTLAGGGCGDPPLCQSDVFVAFQQTMISTDVDAAAPGVQTDIHLRTSLQEGEVVTLEVVADEGTSLGTVASPAAADGSVVFAGVTVPAPRVVLRATGRGICGEGYDEITVDVLPGAECTVQLTPEPERNAYYAPLGVLSQRSDPDPATPGYQATVRVVTRPGWSAEIFRTTKNGEASLGVATAGSDGVATLPVTVFDGQVEFRATCQGAGTELASRTIAIFADTTAPTCGMVTPMPGATITATLDANRDVTDGLQIAIAAHADGADVEGEPVGLTIAMEDGSPISVSPPTPADAGGTSTASASLLQTTPATYDFVLTMRDHAGNTCMASTTYMVMYDDSGCAITATPPAAPVTHDADGDGANGLQADVTLASPACAGQTVTATCGAISSSGIVAQDGSLTLHAEICATSPCQTGVNCTFQVTNAIGIPASTNATIVFDDQPPVTDFAGEPVAGMGILLTWTSPDHGVFGGGPPVAYVLKSSPVPLTDASFDTTGTVEPTNPPGAPGNLEILPLPSAPIGVDQYFAIATIDAAGHRSAVAVTGPVAAVP